MRRLTVLAVNWHSGGQAALYSGGGRRARMILGGLAQRGHQVHVVDVAPSVAAEVPGIASIRTTSAWLRPGVANASFPEQAAAALYASMRLRYLVSQSIKRARPDVVYIPSAELLPCLIAGLFAGRRSSRPVAACATTIVRWKPQGRDTLLHLSRRFLARATGTIVLGPAVAERLKREGFAGHIVTGLTGVEHSPQKPRSDAQRRLFFLSRLVPEKGVGDAVTAFARVGMRNGAVLEICGSGPKKERQRIEVLGKQLGLGEALRLSGPIDTDAQKWAALAASWAFVAPSYIEHFGIAVREALSAGLPTLAYQLPPFEDLRDHPCFFSVPLGDVNSLTQGIERILRLTVTERADLVERGRSRSVGPTWDEAVDREEQLLLEIASG